MQDGRWTIEQCDWEAVSTLSRELELSEVAATILVRRGHRDPAETAAFLAAAPPAHDPFLLGDMRLAVDRINHAVERGERICVHGDYDADGVCATAVAFLALRELGADVSWHLPSRFEEGYGLAFETIESLAADGIGLIVTVDCGITAVAEVARARELGVDVIITDHHRPGDVLPDCPIVATRPSHYPFPELAGTGVAHKLAVALLGEGHPALTRELDLVALGTIADVVPLLDENRGLAAAGLRALACTTRPGLRALMRSAHVDPATIDATSVSFRLAPRINAAGRLRRPDLALELILTDDPAIAESLAADLESLNRERQSVEERILREAVATVNGWSAEQKARRAYVIWGEEWHEGVIGIVASRLVERFGRPVVLIARSADGWKGSGRSIGSFDLHAGLAACSEHLGRFGGHRAAAGLSIATESLEPFAEAFAVYAAGVIADEELRLETKIDAIVPVTALTLDLAQELRRLAPFGHGNPEPVLLAASVQPVEASTVGDGKHLRFRVKQHGRDGGRAIAFGFGSQVERLAGDGRYDLAFQLTENHWNGTVAPQLVVRRLFDAPLGYDVLRASLASQWRDGESAWTPQARAIFSELALDVDTRGRQLLESPTFRALLSEHVPQELPRAA
jgi:single-stranded-DNA-specific exonuclease